VSYILTVDVPKTKNTATNLLGDFVFKPYKINRYGSMATQPGVEIPLEKLWTKYSAKETDALPGPDRYLLQNYRVRNLLQQMDKVPVLTRRRAPEESSDR
jgi:hypothetical protein